MPPLLILLLILIVIVGTTATVYLWRQDRQQSTPVPRLSKRRDKKRKQLAPLLLDWAEQADKHGVGAWMRGLSTSDLNTLVKDVDLYARDMGFDLLWMLDGQIDDIALYDHVNQTVFKYVQSFYLASTFQDDMRLYTILVEFLNNMRSRRNRPKAEAIYRHLSINGAVPDADTEILFARRSKRIQYIEEVIRQTAQTNRDALKMAVREVMK